MSELLTVDQVAERLRIGKRTVERMIANGELRSVKVRRRRLVLEDELDRYLRLEAARRGRVS